MPSMKTDQEQHNGIKNPIPMNSSITDPYLLIFISWWEFTSVGTTDQTAEPICILSDHEQPVLKENEKFLYMKKAGPWDLP